MSGLMLHDLVLNDLAQGGQLITELFKVQGIKMVCIQVTYLPILDLLSIIMIHVR
jgi:hypothetical protein